MIGQDLERYFELVRKRTISTVCNYTEPTKCATCKFAKRLLPDMAKFMTHCTVHEKPTVPGDIPLHVELVYTHVRPGMIVAHMNCNFYVRKEGS
jgi:hypothetical protein